MTHMARTALEREVVHSKKIKKGVKVMKASGQRKVPLPLLRGGEVNPEDPLFQHFIGLLGESNYRNWMWHRHVNSHIP